MNIRPGRLLLPVTATLTGIALHLVAPLAIALVLGLLLMVVTIGEIVVVIIRALGFFIFLQGMSAFVSSFIVGIVASELIERFRPLTALLTLLGSSLFVHAAVLGVSFLAYTFVYRGEVFMGIFKYNLIINAVVAIVLVFVAFIAKKSADRLSRPTSGPRY